MLMITPIVFFCAFISGENHVCDGHTALFKHTLEPTYRIKATETMPEIEIPINNPMMCLQVAYQDIAKEITKFKEDHPNKELEFRIICKSGERT